MSLTDWCGRERPEPSAEMQLDVPAGIRRERAFMEYGTAGLTMRSGVP